MKFLKNHVYLYQLAIHGWTAHVPGENPPSNTLFQVGIDGGCHYSLDWTTGLQNVGSSHTHSCMHKCHTCKDPQALLGIGSLGVMDPKFVLRLGSVNKSSWV